MAGSAPASASNLAMPLTLGSLPGSDASIRVDALGHELRDRFTERPELPGLVVVMDDGKPAGLVSRRRLMELFSKPYRVELYSARSARTLLKEFGGEPEVFAEDMLIDDAARVIAQRAPEDFSDPVIVRRHDHSLQVIDSQVLFSALAQGYATQYRELQLAQESIIENEKLASLGRLVAGIAHEINTPLGIGITAVSAIIDEEAKLSEHVDSGAIKRSDIRQSLSDIRQLGETAQRTLDHAAELVRSFKQVAADQTSETRRTFDLGEELGHIANSLSASVRKAGFPLRLVEGEAIEMDSYPGAITQIITNLVMNAALHAFDRRAGGEVRIDYTRGRPGQVEIRVSDNGKGIAAEQLERIFEPFYTTRRGSGGTGLGLSIVHNLARATLGGSISVHSAVGSGTCFTLQIPLSS
jgi:signal transduction histidine kinase